MLRRRAEEIEQVDPSLVQLANDMAETMRAYEGVGLAANQVGQLQRVIVVDWKPVSGEDRIEAYLNPVIEERRERMRLEEGCLSIPEVREEIERDAWIRLRYLTPEGRERTLEAEGYMSAVFQHEIDHLDGILIIDRVSSLRRNLLRAKLKRIARHGTESA
jgi:peptide deformylase